MIPNRPTFREHSHSNLGMGGYAYHLICVEDPELHVDIRKPAKKPEAITYRHVLLPDLAFRTPDEVRRQLAALTDSEAATVRAMHPTFNLKPHVGWNTVPSCSACRSAGATQDARHSFFTALSWIPGHTRNYANLCDTHAALPVEQIDMLLSELTRRRLERHKGSPLAVIAAAEAGK